MTDNPASATARIVCFGELLLRLASPAPQLLLQDRALEPSFCGAEANVAVGLAGLGHSTSFVSALPANAIGAAAEREIRGLGVRTAIHRVEHSRLGLYFLQPGAMARPAAITYDRARSAFAEFDPAGYDWERLLEGAQWLFVSGITAALGDRPLAALRTAISAAKSAGVRIAFDTNFRPTLWAGREDEAASVLRSLACDAELVFAGRRAVAMMVGGIFDQADPDEGFRAAADALFDASPSTVQVAATRRVVHSSDRQDFTALLADRSGCSVSDAMALERIVDRVGTGDAYAAGVLHGQLEGLGRQATVDFAAACALWAHSVRGDFMRATREDIVSLVNGTKDVRR